MDRRIESRLAAIARRQRQLVFWKSLTIALLGILPLSVAAFFLGGLQASYTLAVAGTVLGAAFCWRRAVAASDLHTVAAMIEKRFPTLDARLLTAIEQERRWPDGFGFLQFRLIEETLTHARIHGWEQVVPISRVRVAASSAIALAAVFTAAIAALHVRHPVSTPGLIAGKEAPSPTGAEYRATIEPGDVERERGGSVIVLARFDGALPDEVTLNAGDRQIPMSKSLADPVFAARIEDLQRDLNYHVTYGSQRSDEYRVVVFDYPDLDRMDASVAFPEYSGLQPLTLEDTRRVTAVEGSDLTLTFHLSKPVKSATLVPVEGPPVETSLDGSTMTASHTLVESGRYHLELVDADGRSNRDEIEIRLVALENRPPELKVQFPGRDMRVSPLEEVAVQAEAWDDFGIDRYGLTYSVPGREPVAVDLGRSAAAKEKREIGHLLAMESIGVEPDQLVSYYFWADDMGPDGKPRRTFSDMYFAEIRPFDEIFRQGQQPPGGASSEQMEGEGGGAERQIGDLAEIQKQIVNATWKLIRRFENPQEDLPVIRDSQQAAIEQLEQLREEARDATMSSQIDEIERSMTEALKHLSQAADADEQAPLTPALAAEQQAYQGLLSMRAREHEIVRGQQQGGGGGGAAGASQRQLQQLELDNDQNRYETRRQASEQRQRQQQQREDNQVLNRLRELSQRQKDLNERLKELQAALQEAQAEEERQKLQRELKRLRDEQQEILRDVDQLRERMEQPENQSRMADANRELQETRSNVREASRALEEGRVPEALTEGTRAERNLDRLGEEFRQRTSNEFEDVMREMRQQARDLAENQQRLSDEMRGDSQPRQRSLRPAEDNNPLADRMERQKEDLSQLLEQMKQVVSDSEESEPLLSKQLYDAYREAFQNKADAALDEAAELARLGFTNEAQEPEGQAAATIDQLQRRVDRAADSILGDEQEALRRAREEIEDLRRQLDRELAQATGQDLEQSDGAPPARSGRDDAGQGRRADDPDAQERPDTKGAPGGSATDARGDETQRPSPDQGGGLRRPRQDEREEDEREEDEREDERSLAERRSSATVDEDALEGASGSGARSEQQEPEESQTGGGEGREPGGSEGAERSEASAQQEGGQGRPGEGAPQGDRDRPDRPQDGQGGGSPTDGGDDRRRGGAFAGGGSKFFDNFQQERSGPLTGEGYREWDERIRDVEQMLQDPQLRSRASQIRDRARAMRIDVKRHAKEPNWSLVEKMIAQPLAELSEQLALELARQDEKNPLVPIDRDPVPRQFDEMVRRYYEELGAGR